MNPQQSTYVVPSTQSLDMLLRLHQAARVSREYVTEVFFNTDEYELPFTFSLQATRTHKTPVSLVAIDGQLYAGNFLLENRPVYVIDGLDLGDMSACFARLAHVERGLRPFTAATMVRETYHIHDAGVHVAFDTNIQYHYFPPVAEKSVLLGNDAWPRLLMTNSTIDDGVHARIISEAKGFPSLPLEVASYGFLNKHRERYAAKLLYKELQGCEVEANLVGITEAMFVQVKNLFKRPQDGFQFLPHYPYTRFSASMNQYAQLGPDHVKFVIKGGHARVVHKHGSTYAGDSNSHVRRCLETKSSKVPLWPEVVAAQNASLMLLRKRKLFWIEHAVSGRVYHLSFDHCEYGNDVLDQLEIEYTGNYSPSACADEKTIRLDIQSIVNILLRQFPSLRASRLTKKKWLLSHAQLTCGTDAL